MAYTTPAFQTKKALKQAIADGKTVHVKGAGVFPPVLNGTEYVEGPEGKPHSWYAAVTVKDGKITKVKN
jgi:hypothetical protein